MNVSIDQETTLLRDFLDRENDLGILLGSHQNLDTYASALSLYLSLIQAGKKVQIVSKKAPTVEVSNLVGIDKVKENFSGSTTKLVVALPYNKGEVEKVLFTEAPNTINFHLTAAPNRSITPFDAKDVKLIWEGGAPSAIIAIGVGNEDEIALVADPNNIRIVNIDNYQGNSRYGDVVLVDESFSSLSEICAKVIKELSLPMDPDIAQNILDGVLFATRNFTKGNTSPFAFEAASNAMYQGAQRKDERTSQDNSDQRSRQMTSQDRSRDQRQDRDRGMRDQRPQGRQQRASAFPEPRESVSTQRVQDNDFPAMHMQGGRPTQNQPQENRRMSSFRNQLGSMRGGQQFGQNQNVDDIRNKIIEESRRPRNDAFQAKDDRALDAEIIEDQHTSQRSVNQPVEDVKAPQDQPYNSPSNEDIPDDWLMPKVFKSSKNNN